MIQDSDFYVTLPSNASSNLFPKDLERSRLTTIFIKVTTHLKDMFRSCNDHLQLKVELI